MRVISELFESGLRDDDVGGFIDDEALGGIEALIGGGEFAETEAAGDGEVERIVGEQGELLLKLQGEVKILGQDGFDEEAAAKEVADFVGVIGKRAEEAAIVPEGAGWIGADEAARLRLLNHAPVAKLGEDGGGDSALQRTGGAAGKQVGGLP